MARRVLEVDAHELLLAPDHAQLDRGVQSWIGCSCAFDALLAQELAAACPASSSSTTESRLTVRAQRGRVARDVRRAAGALLERSNFTTGTGASGEMRPTSPNQ